MENILEIKNLNKNFDGLNALHDFSFELKEKEILGLIGPNGAGKTTFFNVLSGFIKPESGKVEFLGKDITKLSSHKIVSLGNIKNISRSSADKTNSCD